MRKPLLQLSEADTQLAKVITCPGCKAPVSETKFGVRSHLMRKPECSKAMSTLGWNTDGSFTAYGKRVC